MDRACTVLLRGIRTEKLKLTPISGILLDILTRVSIAMFPCTIKSQLCLLELLNWFVTVRPINLPALLILEPTAPNPDPIPDPTREAAPPSASIVLPTAPESFSFCLSSISLFSCSNAAICSCLVKV